MSFRVLQPNGLPHPYVMLLLAPLLWASSNVIGKQAKGWLSPAELTLYRWLLATLILSVTARRAIARDWCMLRQRWLWLFLVGGSGFGLFNIVLYSAFAQGASVANVSIITALIPLLVMLGSMLFWRQGGHALQWLGMALSFFGVLWLMTNGHPTAFVTGQFAPGDAIALGCSGIYAAYSLLMRYAPPVHWASLLWAMCLAGLLVALPFYVYGGVQSGFRLPSWQAVVLVVYVAICVSILSKLFYMESVIQIGANRAALAMNFLPLFGVLLGVAFFADEQLSANHGIALLLVLAGIFTSEWGVKRLSIRQ
ncbi:MAG: DMT family transporter [Cardiobacteriaceae bacterium]|nr:DMT family transporter [Cardiobacteriaceae bacterium]